MAKFIKISVVVCSMLAGVFLFQNCKIQKDADGNYQSIQKFPENMNAFVYNIGFSSSKSESSSYFKINLVDNKINIFKLTSLNPSEQACEQTLDLDANLKAEFLELYDRANYCFSTVKAKPGIVCTMELRMTENIGIYNNDKELFSDRVGAPNECYSGAVFSFCSGGEELHAFLKDLLSDLMASCDS